MVDFKYSGFLRRLMEKSLQIGDAENAALTAERFLVAAFDWCQSEEELRGYERRSFRTELQKAFTRMEAARRLLLTYIRMQSNADELYMLKMLQEAERVCQNQKAPVITARMLLQCILDDPSKTIKMICFAAGSEDEMSNEAPPEKPTFDVLLDTWAFGEEDTLDQEEPSSAKEKMAQMVSDVKRIRRELQAAIFGQDNAVNLFVTGYFQAGMRALMDKSSRRPLATYLFAGPPGVGKTFLAETAAKALKLPFMRFDMSEYADKEGSIEFCGSDKVYKNGKVGNVTSFVAENPKCVLLFDEIEKAHVSVIHLFLQMLDAGRLRDNYTDKEVPFGETIIILTTNAGKQLYEGSESTDLSGVSRKVVLNALRKDINPATKDPYFPNAICSRFASGNVVMFNHISAHDLQAIAKKEIRRHADNLQAETGIALHIDEQVYTALLFSEGSTADARTIRSRAETFFNDELFELLRLIASDKTHTGIENVEDVQVSVDLSTAGKEICKLFQPEQALRVLVFADQKTVAACREVAPGLCVLGTQSSEEAVSILKEQPVSFVLLDIWHGVQAGARDNLNVEDVESAGRAFFKILREHTSAPAVYLLETQERALSEEEMVSFLRQGVRGTVCLSADREEITRELDTIAQTLYQQASMVRLATENKVISFETAQQLSKDGKHARIKLFDFAMTVAVDSEDAKNVLTDVSRPDVHFDEVIGAQDAKDELSYFVEYLKEPNKYMGTGVKAPKGVLLYGPPGTGKTMLAKAMACEADVTFIATEGNRFLKQYTGEGAEYVHQLFRTARKYAPSILFIDEIDAIAKERKGGDNSEATLTAFLTEMDGFVNDPSKPVFVLAATNFDVMPGGRKSLDPALMRRFDRRVYIDLPNKEDRVRFLTLKGMKNKALEISEAQIDHIAMRTTGMSLAELDSVVELALRSAIRAGSTKVTDVILEEALETFHNGEVKNWDESTLERVARHEAGHALISWLNGETPPYVTIVARGNHGGYMQHANQENKQIYTKDELLGNIRTALGGRAAELVYYGKRDGVSTSAGGDLASATYTAQQLLCSFGMDDAFGLAVVGGAPADGVMSAQVHKAVNRILAEQMQKTVRLISENKDKIDALVVELMRKNHLNGPQVEAAIRKSETAGITGA